MIPKRGLQFSAKVAVQQAGPVRRFKQASFRVGTAAAIGRIVVPVFTLLAVWCGRLTAAVAQEIDLISKRTSCLISANSVIKLSSQAQGLLAKVNVQRGDPISAMAVVAELESSVEQATLQAAKLKAEADALVSSKAAELGFAEQRLGRQRELAGKNIVSASAQSLEEAETRVAVARSDLLQAELDRKLAAVDVERLTATLERRILRSPVNGVVATVEMHPGEYADPANVIATISETQPLKVEVYLPTDAYPMIRPGMRAEIRPQEPIGGSYVAEVASKDAQIDAASGLFQIRLRLDNPDNAIPAGLRCTVRFLRDDRAKPSNK
jgi:RND family efflux transporter MFP subunit